MENNGNKQKQRLLVETIKDQMERNFYNLEISMKTCDRDADICGAPSWRYFYHTLHSCDRWFFNPFVYTEPAIHAENLDQVDLSCKKVLSEQELWDYFMQVKQKVNTYLDGLTDADLYEKPEACSYTRMQIILGQMRHFMAHVGIFNGITIAHTGRYPMCIGLTGEMDGRLWDE